MPDNVYHLDRCGRCRASLAVLSESVQQRDSLQERYVQRLAASTLTWAQVTSFSTADGSLTCDLYLQEHCSQITLVGDPVQWGESVVLWPGPAEPLLLKLGGTESVASRFWFSFECWRIGKLEAELSFSNQRVVRLPDNQYLAYDYERSMLTWKSPVHSLLAIKRAEEEWVELELPTKIRLEDLTTVRIYSPLTAVDLKI